MKALPAVVLAHQQGVGLAAYRRFGRGICWVGRVMRTLEGRWK